jgi:23S rRNA (guanosine2251-2'-O)-methyltransferase
MKTRPIVYGINAVDSLLRRSPERIEALYLQAELGQKRMGRIQSSIARSPVEADRCSAQDLEKLTGTRKHQGVAARVTESIRMMEAEALDFIQTLTGPLILVLDGVQDPRNFGACLRTAEAAGVDLVVVARSRNVGYTPVVSKVAAGAAELQPVAEVANLSRFLGTLQESGIRLLGACDDAPQSLFDTRLTGPLAMVLGGEGKGLRRLTRERCAELVHLPMCGAVESLNVSVAAGICLYEALRQRR